MRTAICPIFVILGLSGCFCAGCGRSDDSKVIGPQNTPGGVPAGSDYHSQREASTKSDYQSQKEAALQLADKLRESGPPRIVILPNFEGGPNRPMPILTNFYEVLTEYPAYLVCTYSVVDSQYNTRKEPAWFTESLLQIREAGRERFYSVYRGLKSPLPLKWVAVVLVNDAEFHGVGTFEQIHKVGAIFNIDEVFVESSDLSQLVAAAQMDRHPFVYDPKNGESWEAGKHDRWMIVDRHAATTRRATP